MIQKFEDFINESLKTDVADWIKSNNITYDPQKDPEKLKFVDDIYKFLAENPGYYKKSPTVTRLFKEYLKLAESTLNED